MGTSALPSSVEAVANGLNLRICPWQMVVRAIRHEASITDEFPSTFVRATTVILGKRVRVDGATMSIGAVALSIGAVAKNRLVYFSLCGADVDQPAFALRRL